MLPRNHPDRIQIAFDDHRLVSNAGLILPWTLRIFGRYERGRLRVDDTDRPGVLKCLSQLRIVKNLPTPATCGAVPERGHPMLVVDFA